MSEKKVCPACGSDKIENHRYNPDDHGLCWYDNWVCLNCGKEGFKPSNRKINMFKDIVPPFEMCVQIPSEKFIDSVFVWVFEYGKWEIQPRAHFVDKKDGIYPAPTLQEIIAELTPGEDGCGELTQFGKDKHGWFMMTSFEGNDDGYGSGFETYEEKDRDNPATAALKLWLKLNREEDVK